MPTKTNSPLDCSTTLLTTSTCHLKEPRHPPTHPSFTWPLKAHNLLAVADLKAHSLLAIQFANASVFDTLQDAYKAYIVHQSTPGQHPLETHAL